MDAKTGDRVSLDGKKVGQPKRTGVIRKVTKGISGIRYEVSWDDGTSTMISPSGGILTIETNAKSKPKAKAKPARKPKKKTAKRR